MQSLEYIAHLPNEGERTFSHTPAYYITNSDNSTVEYALIRFVWFRFDSIPFASTWNIS